MTIRKLHTLVGLTLLLPFMAWIFTAMVFYIKPGYEGAYELLRIKTYPLDNQLTITPDSSWLEFRYFRTILGNHLLARTNEGWKHLLPREKPSSDEIRKLVTGAFSSNPERYGQVSTISNDTIVTTTGIHVVLDWEGMSLYQRGADTDRIDLLYRIHYLQWTGIDEVDKILGPLGLVLVFTLSMLGIRLAVTSRK